MNSIIITTGAKLFCLVIIAFVFIFKVKNMLNASKRSIAADAVFAFGIISSVVSGVASNTNLQTVCYVLSAMCYAVALFFMTEDKKPMPAAFIAVAFGVATFYSMRFGLNVATYILTVSSAAILIFQLYNLIMTDNLTGLYNLYARKLEIEEQEREYRYDHTDSFYVFSCDLDRFKTINDTWGHAEGDRALSLVAAALTKVAAQFDAKVFRVGGDEFQIIADTSDERVAEQIENALEMEFAAINFRDDFDIKISIGKILYNGEGSTDQLLAEADSRMYAEKNRKKK